MSGLLLAGEPERLQLAEELVVASPIIEGDRATDWGGLVTTVSAEQIDDLNAHDLAAALRRTPGVTITRYNRVGAFAGGEGGAVFVRGMGSSRPGGEIALRIDGITIANPVWNHPLLDLASIGPAASIEVYKGPQPANFGNAFSAVNIVPKSWTSECPGTRLSLAFGNDSTWHQGVETGAAYGPFDIVLGETHSQSDGHRPYSSGRVTEAYGQIGIALDEHWRLAFFGLATDAQAEDPGLLNTPASRDGTYESRDWLGTVTLSHEYDQASGAIKFYMTKGSGEWYDQATTLPTDTRDTLNDWRNYGVHLHEDIRPWEGGTIRLGLDHDISQGQCKYIAANNSASYFDRHTLHLFSPYAAVAQRFELEDGWWFQPSAGLRYYKHNYFGEAFAPQAGLTFGKGAFDWHLSYARGVVYPGINVIVIFPLANSWRDLDPELVDHFEGGVTWRANEQTTLGLTLFYDEGNDRYVFAFPGPAWTNIESFRQRGGELTATFRPREDLSLFAGATYLDPDPSDLPYAPEWTLTSGFNWRFLRDWELNADVTWIDSMHASSQARRLNAVNSDVVGSHLLANVKVTYHFTLVQRVEGKVFVAVENAFDEDYEYQPGYPMPGISFMTGVEVSF
jgi:iron complex outermembrane receptor protein